MPAPAHGVFPLQGFDLQRKRVDSFITCELGVVAQQFRVPGVP